MHLPQGRNEGDKGGTIPRAPSHYGGAEKLQQYHKFFICFRKTSVSNIGGPNLLLVPGAI